MTVGRARLWHVPQLLRILWAETREGGAGARRPDEDIVLMVKLCWRGQVSLARSDGRVRAFIARDGIRVHALYTAPCWRGQGAGTQLLGVAKSMAERLELWCAQSNAGARRFYAANGFYEARLTGGEGNDEGQPDVLMKWERLSE